MTNSLEENARRAKEACSFSDYRTGSATAEYNEYCAEADEIAAKAKARLAKAGAPAERAEKVEYLLASYKAKKLAWLNDLYTNRGRVPSVLVCGPANFPVKAKQRQNAREDALMNQTPEYILDEIRGIGNNATTIYSDDENAVERIKAKIEALKGVPDPYGNKSAEVRRLKERLLKLAQAAAAEAARESTEAATVTINGETAEVIRNKEATRLQLVFEGKPDEATRTILKSNGFRWAPSCVAWQRLLNDNAEYSLKRITD